MGILRAVSAWFSTGRAKVGLVWEKLVRVRCVWSRFLCCSRALRASSHVRAWSLCLQLQVARSATSLGHVHGTPSAFPLLKVISKQEVLYHMKLADIKG